MLQDYRQILKTPERSQHPDLETRKMTFSLGKRSWTSAVMRNKSGFCHHSAINANAGGYLPLLTYQASHSSDNKGTQNVCNDLRFNKISQTLR